VIGEAAALGAAFCWAVGSHLWGRIGRSADAAPGALNLGKCIAGALFFGATGLAVLGRPWPDLPGRTLGLLVLSGIIGLTLGDSAYFGAMAILGVRRALLLLSTAPVFAALGDAVLLGQPPRAAEGAAIAAVLAGVAVVVYEQPTSTPGDAPSPVLPRGTLILGLIFGVGSGVGQAAGSLASRAAMTAGATPLETALVRVPAALAGMVALSAATGRLVPYARSLARPRLVGAIAGAAFVGTYVGIWLSQLAIGRSSSTAVASTLLATSPIFALPLGRWLNGERITARALAGTVLACAGLGALTFSKS
jgi:drug/metabolite transporter (DMT)-like permease